MTESLFKFCVDVLKRTGREDLLETARQIEKREKELLTQIDEQPGHERAERALRDDELALEKDLSPKVEKWIVQLEKVDHLRRADLAEVKLVRIRIEELMNEFNQLSGKLNTPRQQSTEIDVLLERVHADYIQSLKALLKQLQQPLRGYSRAKALAFAVPKAIYLVFTLIIFAIGASLAGEQFEGMALKLGFAVLVWAVQEFFITPFAEKKLREYKRDRLRRFIYRLTLIRIWAIFLAADVEHKLKEEL